jgi:putative protease
LNTIVYDDEILKAKKIIIEAKKAGIDAIIAWDMAVVTEALRQGINVHLSTQASVSNFESLKFYANLGIKNIVLARECTLLQIKEIIDKIKKDNLPIEIETFIHGAMCVSLSGRCFMSQFLSCKSANRGECLQPCRREYDLVNKETKETLTIGNNYVLSAKDLSTITFIDRLIEAGISSFKIEGRAKTPEYVTVVVSSYRKAIDAYFEGYFTPDLAKELEENMKKVFNRGFSDGFFMGAPINEFADCYGGKSTLQKDYVGFVKNFYSKIQVAEIKIESNPLSQGDSIMFQGPTTGVVEEILESMQVNYQDIKTAKKGKSVAVKLKNKVRPKDKVFVLKEKN